MILRRRNRAHLTGRSRGGRTASNEPSARELQVLALLADGLQEKEIAGRLGISHWTVKSHTKKLYAKLDARNGPHAVAQGLRSGLID